MDILVLEVTSHALVQFRTMGIPISIAVMTNITHEHLDYHGTFEAYLQAKLKLFKQAARNKQGLRLGIINADDDNAAVFSDAVPNVAAYSLDPASGPKVAHPEKLKLTPSGSSYQMVIEDEHYNITCKLPGSFNVSNSLAAALVGRALGLDKQVIERGIAALEGVEGRMTRIDEGQSFDVIVDFAHTPDSFEKLFADTKPVVKGRLITLFGSAGRRDEAKRYTQGEIAGRYSDIIYITEEDDRDIDGNQIMAQIAEGAERSGKVVDKDVHLLLDRETALRTALTSAKKGDTVMLLGKGHEKTIERAEGSGGTKDHNNPWEVHDWDEIALTRKILKFLKKKK